ncbi:MAG: response regulator transcription factor [Actinobacteria bacterium]|nr:response regulator transcription factor [Actinomycetota bacterium]
MNAPRVDPATITCVLADDHPPIIDSVARHLTAMGFSVVATAHDGEQALAALVQRRPSVCIADVRMPRIDGVELARRAAAAAPETAVLLYSGFSDRSLMNDALDAGARGFALKDAPLGDLVRAIELVAAGNLYVDPVLAASLARPQADESKGLTTREREVLRLLAAGDTYGEIGAALFLSPDTVRTHAHHAMTKLGTRTRTQAVAVALRTGLIG